MEIIELALAYWRLNNWVEKSNEDRKNAAYSALRQIKLYLSERQVEIVDFLGQKYDDGLAVDVLDCESDEVVEAELYIVETIRPTIICNGNVVKYGQVIVGNRPVESTSNHSQASDEVLIITNLITQMEVYRASSIGEKKIINKLRQIKSKLQGQILRLSKGDKHI